MWAPIAPPVEGTFIATHSTEGMETTIRIKYPCIAACQLWPVGTDMIDSLQWQMVGEPYTPYRIKAAPLWAEEEGPPT
jgi:hypothetical protein